MSIQLRNSGSGIALSSAVAAEFAAAVAATVGVAAILTTEIPVAGAVSASGTVAGQLSTEIPLAAVLTGSATLAAELTTAIPVAGALTSTAGVAGALTTEITYEAAESTVVTVAAQLTTNIPLEGAVTGLATVGGVVTTSIPVAAALSATGNLAVALTTEIALTTAIAGTGSLAADLTTSLVLAATITTTATVAAALTTEIPLAAASTGTGTVAAALTTDIPFLGTTTGIATVAAALTTAIPLEGAVVAAATLVGELTAGANVALAAAISGTAVAAASLTTAIPLAAARSGTASCTATLTVPSGGGSATLAAQLYANTPSTSAYLGEVVAISKDGSVIVTAAPYESGGGALYIRSGTGWATETRIVPTGFVNYDELGSAIACSDDGAVVAVSTYYATSYTNGVVFVYSGANWATETILEAADPTNSGGGYGYGLAVSGDGTTVAVSDPYWGTDSTGRVYVYHGASWGTETVIDPSSGSDYSEFGVVLALTEDGSTLVAGAPELGTAGNPPYYGGAYVYSGTLWGTETLLQGTTPQADSKFGSAVDITGDGSILAVGAATHSFSGTQRGAVYVYSGGSWVTEVEVLPQTPVDFERFGTTVALSTDGQGLVVSAQRWHWYYPENTLTGSGRVLVFEAPSYTEKAVIENPGTSTEDEFGDGWYYGYGSDISGDESTVVVGFSGKTGPGNITHAGAVYVYQFGLSASITATATSAPYLTARSTFDATCTAAATVAAALTAIPSIRFDGTLTATATLTGNLIAPVRFSGALSVSATVVGAILADTRQRVVMARGFLQKEGTRAVTTDAIAVRTYAKAVTTDGYLVRDKTLFSTAFLLGTYSKTITSTAKLIATGQKTVTAQGSLTRTQQHTVTCGAQLAPAVTSRQASVLATTALLKQTTKTVGTDALLSTAVSVGTRSVTASSVLVISGHVRNVVATAVLLYGSGAAPTGEYLPMFRLRRG